MPRTGADARRAARPLRADEADDGAGAFLDPVADKLMVCTTLVLLAASPPEPLSRGALAVPGVVMIGREIVMSALREWAAASGAGAHKVGRLLLLLCPPAIGSSIFHCFLCERVAASSAGGHKEGRCLPRPRLRAALVEAGLQGGGGTEGAGHQIWRGAQLGALQLMGRHLLPAGRNNVPLLAAWWAGAEAELEGCVSCFHAWVGL